MMRAPFHWMICLSSLVGLCWVPAQATAQEGPPRVQIDTLPSGANVYVDDRSAGIQCQSGAMCRLKLKKGPHKLILELDGHRTQEQTIAVTGAQRFWFKLAPLPASLDVRTLATNQTAQGAELFVDGKLKGVVPSVLEVSEGKHLVEVRRGGFEAYAEHVELKAGEQRPMFVSLSITPQAPQPQPPSPVIERTPAPIIVQMPPTQAPPPPPGDPTVPVAIVPHNPKFTYIATLGQGQSCSTPCTVYAVPGTTTISVSGPGSKFFQEPITIPSVPSQIAVQHFTLSRAISGPILLTLGSAALALGSLWMDSALVFGRASSLEVGTAAFTLLHGIAFFTAGIGELARIKTNRADLRSGR
jgi:hypothetical protein